MEMKIIKILEENIGKYFHDLGEGKNFLAGHQKIDKFDFNKI